MADPFKCRIGQRVSVVHEGRTYVGEFGGMIPGVRDHYEKRAREDRIILRGKSLVTYIPYRKGTEFKYLKGA